MGEKLTIVQGYIKEDGTEVREHRRRTAKERRNKTKQFIDRLLEW